MNLNANFEKDYYSRTAKGIYRIGHDSIRILKGMAYYDRSCYGNINSFDLMRSFLTCLNEKKLMFR